MGRYSEEIDAALKHRAPDFNENLASLHVAPSQTVPDFRDPYQHDLGRIIHSASFRRLQAKTQVMGTGEGDFHRTRLTHSLEVGQIGRGIVWQLNRTESAATIEVLPSLDLIEAICYAHDLGHPPFGHGGERALHRKMKPYGGFEGNAQTIRILTHLEKYSKESGIRPTRRLLLGVLKYPVKYSAYKDEDKEDKPPKCYYDLDSRIIDNVLSVFNAQDRLNFQELGKDGKPVYKSFDATIMELADDIAYGVHDLEDGVGRGFLLREDVADEIGKRIENLDFDQFAQKSNRKIIDDLFSRDSWKRKYIISKLVGYFIRNIRVSERGIFQNPILDLEAYLPYAHDSFLRFLKIDVVYKRIVAKRGVQTLEYKGEKLISELFDAFCDRPISLIGAEKLDPFRGSLYGYLVDLDESSFSENEWRHSGKKTEELVARGICDFIAGMTNTYAERYHRRLFEPGFGSSTDEL